MLTLYHHGSSACAAKVRFALAEKRLDWEGHYIDLMKGEQFSPEFLRLNPKAVVPVLVHDERIVPESTLICEYLDEVFPENPIYPVDPWLRLKVRLWTKAVDEELHPACSAITYMVSHRHTILKNGAGDFESFLAAGSGEGRMARQRKWHWLQQGLEAPDAREQFRVYLSYLDRMEAALTDSDWLVGSRFSMADIAMAPYVNRLSALAMEPLWSDGRLPRVAAWFERVQSRRTFETAFVRWLPESLAAEMRGNGERAWPQVARLLEA